MIFGRGGGGGVVNRVTKVPTFGSRREFALIGDSEGGVRATADVDQRIGQAIGLRINAMVEDGDSFRREVDLDRHAINPTLAINVGDATRIDLSYEYLHDERTTDRGVPADGSRPIEGYDRTFFGDPGRSFADADVHIATVAVEHRLAEGLTLRNRTLYGDYDKFYQNVYPSDYLEATRQVRLAAYNDVTTRRNLFSQTDLVWNSRLGGIDQTLLLGFEVGHQEGRNQRRNGLFSSTATGPTSILVPVDAATVDTPVTYVPNGPNVRIDASIAAAFVQDQIRLASFADLIVGLRFDRFSLEVDNLSSGVTFRRTDRLWSPRVGLVLKPAATLSLYSSYSRSYLPSGGDQFSSLDVTSDALKPERFDNIEAGAKWEPLPGLLATAAVYQLDRTNTRAPGPTPGTVVLTGEQRSRGLEIGLERSVTDRWQISAGYAWQRAEVRERTSACNPATARCEVPLVPRHTFSLWTRYDVTRDLGLGLGVIARSKSFASIGNAVTLPGYQRIDAAVFYKLTDAIQAQINVENLLGADYFATAHNDNNIAPGAPTTARASVRFAF